METTFRCLLVLLALFAPRVRADCNSYGVDYSNGGSYYIDGSSNQYFTFITVFQGCTQESISPVLVGPDDNEYACSAVNTQPAGTQVTSTCGIPFSAMKSGVWRIIVSGNQIAVQRTITLTVGTPATTWITACTSARWHDGIVIGYTTTAKAKTVLSTVSQTQTLILVPQTVTAACNGATRTVTAYPQVSTVTVTSTVVRTATDGQVTSYWTTTASTTASCHYPTASGYSTSYDNNPFTSARPTSCGNDCQPTWRRGGGGWGWGGRGGRGPTGSVSDPTVADKRDVAATAAVAAVTSTYTETTYTFTSTIQTTIPAKTTTELAFKTVTATVAPAPSTVCANGGTPGATVTVNRGSPTTATQINLIYQTTHLSGTLWIGQTQYTTYTNAASATACWRAGGWFGA
ncbi:hypothetical protein QBC46DRAFT_319704 [Diplogelasinospora grovesii]|uniref:Uncharacterized protein n=1 Tax=Diplogelasinospora grovesii TaxID=303347 RepID=A0AAN6N4S7_9PEZI|nr:hypothetical protein QBC46DRAFT_319704 [Diplogelasinospora grovesii]